MKRSHKLLLMALISLLAFSNCKTSKLSTNCWNKCENAVLYYLPDCQEIKGYVNLQENGLQRVFQHDIPEELHGDSIPVCIKYKNVGVGILMSDCLQSDIIELKCISKGHKGSKK